MIPLPTFLALWNNPLVRYGIIALALGLVVLFARQHWISDGREQVLRENLTNRLKYVAKVETVIQQVRVPYVKTETKIETVYREIEKEAANVPSRPACNITVGWMHYHNNATDPDRREPGALDDPADSRITEAEAARTIAANYKAYHQVANDLMACRAAFSGIGAIKP